VTAADGVELRNAHEFVRHVQKKKVGDTLQLTVQRRGQTLLLPVTTGEQPLDVNRLVIPRPVSLPPVQTDLLGLELADADGEGAKVVTVVPGSPAASVELKPADVLTEVNAEPTPSAQSASEAIRSALNRNPEKGVLVNYLRAGKKSWVVIERSAR